MSSDERVRTIVQALRAAERISVVDLARETACSEMTIRRDLDLLAAQGVLRRVRGGAVSLLPRGDEPPFALRELEELAAKKRIGAAAAAMVTDGEAVVVDGGTTGREVARALIGRRITAMPLGLHVANTLSAPAGGHGGVRLLMPGGEVRAGELVFTGHLTTRALRSLRFDTVILGCCGISAEHGLTTFDLDDVDVKQAALESSRRVIAVADATKFARTALGQVCPLARIDVLITDTSAPERVIADFQAAGVEVRRV
ncbi:DeoR/GlpR family DNA-binding transcription regulator [Fodinicola feengrottensis]|uniref:DeoR/GlpR family DNA-binding transcription regulator n=1 Tax=Fodinicola feengrottensis TaxID=435914 RepID=UPI0013D8250C|nr:DeoR/GlpR family DNA-binding transcription regulator [Fodinicola feengrottensis]